jgi:hypothetical protein
VLRGLPKEEEQSSCPVTAVRKNCQAYSLLKFPNFLETLAIFLEKSLLDHLCHFAILKTDR